MCCFSRPVVSVTNTNIFARSSEGAKQYLVYQMTLDAREELAMVLPLPVPPKSAEKAVRFLNLDTYPGLFQHLQSGVFPPPPQSRGGGTLAYRSASAAGRPPLPVAEVGSFVASFVPAVSEFDRLDPRFQLPQGTWEKLPQYKDWGFAVFKLKPGVHTLHPMAFEFPRRNPRQLFFPTVHIHDGKVHTTAEFDHTVYCQHYTAEKFPLHDWTESPLPAGEFILDAVLHKGIIHGKKHVYGLTLTGQLKNQDTILSY